MRKKSFMALILAFALVVTSLTSYETVSATTTQDKLNSVKSQISALQGEASEVESQLSSVQKQIAGVMAEMDVLAGEMEITNGQIEMAEVELEEAIATQEKQYQDMKTRIRYMYENSNTSYLTLLLEAKSFSDLLNQIKYIDEIYEYDRDLLDQYEANTKRIQELKEELEQQMAELQALEVEYEAQAASLEQMELQLEGQAADYAEQIAAAKALATKYEQQIAAEKAAAAAAAAAKARKNGYVPGTTGTSAATGAQCESVNGELNPPHATSVDGSALVAYARQYLGNPYVWGGNDPVNGIDCSGFTMHCMKTFGVSIYRTAAMQCTQGQEVSLKYAQPGDLVFYAYDSGIVHHVAIYEGNGMIIHASSPSTGIIESAVTYKTIYCIKRMT